MILGLCLCGLWSIPISGEDQKTAGLLDYHDYHETVLLLDQLAEASNVVVESIGVSIDFRASPPVEHPIRALHISAAGAKPLRTGDDLRPSIMFDAGIHAREWIASESLVELAQFLVEQSQIPGSRTSKALQHVDVWVIPNTNPIGRIIDDPHTGDARVYYKEGPEAGGWRGNGDTRTSKFAIDVARNFSVDWKTANADPDAKHWRGLVPFAASEAVALRQFVQNHFIGMAVHIHSNSQDVATRKDGVCPTLRRRVREVWLQGAGQLANQLQRPLDELKLDLDAQNVAFTRGQFAGWLLAPSDTPDQPDTGTLRAMQAVFLELPFDNPKHANYYNGIFQYQPSDGSSSFHPSGQNNRLLIQQAFVPMAVYLIEQAAAPWCVTREDGSGTEQGGQLPADVGVLAAKISKIPEQNGSIVTFRATQSSNARDATVTPAYDAVEPGSQSLNYWIQNYGTRAVPCAVRTRLEYRNAGDNGSWRSQRPSIRRVRSIRPLEKISGKYSMRISADREYRLTVEVAAERDDFLPNNRKVFRFVGQTGLQETRR
jgi:hypothetical protein